MYWLMMSKIITPLAPCLKPKKMHFIPLWASLVLRDCRVEAYVKVPNTFKV